MDVHAARTSPLNFVDAVSAGSAVSGPVRIADVTLRDGEQMANVAFTPEEKVEVAARLAALGVHRIQVGFAPRDARAVRLIKQAGITVPLELCCAIFVPTWQADVDAALVAGTDVLHLIMRSADGHLASLGFSRERAIEHTIAAIEYARSQGARLVVFAPSFCTQADLGFLKELFRVAVRAGAEHVAVADSLGVARPAAFKFLIEEVGRTVDVPIGVHCHNDFGLAVACTLAGLEGGATWADVALNGLGERGGNASLEEVVLALRCLYGIDVGLRTERLYETTRSVMQLLGVPIPACRPVIGDNTFAQKLDIHVMVAAQQPELFEPYDPALVGNRRWLRLGKGSGPHAVRAKLAELGLCADDDQVTHLVALVNETAERTKGFVADEAFVQLLQRLQAGAPAP